MMLWSAMFIFTICDVNLEQKFEIKTSAIYFQSAISIQQISSVFVGLISCSWYYIEYYFWPHVAYDSTLLT